MLAVGVARVLVALLRCAVSLALAIDGGMEPGVTGLYWSWYYRVWIVINTADAAGGIVLEVRR